MITHEHTEFDPVPDARVTQTHPGRIAAVLLLVAVLIGTAGWAGYQARGSASSAIDRVARAIRPTTNGSSGATSTGTTGIANSLDDSIVNLTTTLSSGGAAAGTGIIISATGIVLTNNHVIADSTAIQAEVAATGRTYSGTVLGYDSTDDVAVVKLRNASGLTAASIGDASTLSVGDEVTALGNALGRGGAPSVASGTVTALDRPITASDQDGANTERLTHLIQTDAGIQPGDSGGPLANADGQVVGMDTAAGRSGAGFGFRSEVASEGYAIPIQSALAVAHSIVSGQGGTNIHLGATRAVLGIEVDGQAPDGSSAAPTVIGVATDSGADAAGIQAGDVITAVNGIRVSSAGDLTHRLLHSSPRDVVQVTWVDDAGTNHRARVTLGSAPPA
ncbi:MAG: trypsin-like peptidase domain-containing protein [Acidimicrobiia bacterium]